MPSLELPPSLRRRLERLTLARGRRGGYGRAALRAGASRQGRAAFLEHRPYTPGDDLRDLDWFAYARLDAPYVKVYGADRARHLRIVLDRSASMGVGGKDTAACLLALAAAYAALVAGDRVTLDVVPRGTPSAPPLFTAHTPRAWRTWADRLAADSCAGVADWAAWARTRRRGTGDDAAPYGVRWLVVSDFLDPEAGTALASAADARRSVALAAILDREADRAPRAARVELVDAETGDTRSLWLDDRRLALQRRNVENHADRWAAWAARRGWAWTTCPADAPTGARLLETLLRTGWWAR